MDVAYGITPASTMLEVKLTANNADTGVREIHILTLIPINQPKISPNKLFNNRLMAEINLGQLAYLPIPGF